MELAPGYRDPRFPADDEVVLPQIIRRLAASQPDEVFAVFQDGEEWSYDDLARRTWRRARGLIDLGVAPGDHVATWLPIGPAVLEAWFATNAAGAIYAPINLSYKGSLLRHALDLTGAKVLIAHAELIDRLADVDLAHLETVIVVGGQDVSSRFRQVPWAEVASDDDSCPDTVSARRPWDDMALIFTSGTTGPSKGVRCSYLNHYVDSFTTVHPEWVTGADRFFLCLPMFHCGGTKATYAMLRRGGSLAVVPEFRTGTFWDDVRSLGATTGILMGSMTSFLTKQPARDDDQDNPLRVLQTGPMPDDVAEFSRRFDVAVYTNFAQTEMPAVVRSELNPENTKSCGRQVDPDLYEARIVDEFDQELPPGVVGELVVRHAWPWALNSGYKDMPEATARAWRNGWYHTGDGHYRDEDGSFYFVDRLTDSLRRRGENVSSMELEAAILSHEDVAEAACVAVRAEDLEDEIKAVVTLRPGAELSFEALTEFLVPLLPYFMIPRYFEVVDALPRTPSLKVEKYQLRSQGITPATWDREASGLRLRREKFSEVV